MLHYPFGQFRNPITQVTLRKIALGKLERQRIGLRRARFKFFSFSETKKMHKAAATEIHEMLKDDPVLGDEIAGWHVIVGKSFASAITYQTDNVIFFDLPGEVYTSVLMFKT